MKSASQEQDIISRAREEIWKKHKKTPEQLYEEREKRISDAIAVKEPDRVPVALPLGEYFPLRYTGVPLSAAFYEPAACKQALIKTLLDFEPDICTYSASNMSGLALEALDPILFQWPGGNLPSDHHHQWAAVEYMHEDEYDLFITDPTDFILRYYLPRVWKALETFSKIPDLGQTLTENVPFISLTRQFATPQFQKMAQAVLKAGQEEEKANQVWKGFDDDMISLGFPPFRYPGGVGPMPFDVFASHLRGMRGVMFDMFRQPEKLITACERVLEWRLARAKPADPTARGYPRRVQASGFHYAADNFISKKQFETFCWPTYKKSLLTTIELGFLPTTFCEGRCDNKIEYFLELPKGKLLPRFEELDMARAKAILGGHICIMGNVPASLLQVGSSQEVEEYCRNLIKVCGKGGGFILAPSCGLDVAKPSNIKTMIDSAEKYGRY